MCVCVCVIMSCWRRRNALGVVDVLIKRGGSTRLRKIGKREDGSREVGNIPYGQVNFFRTIKINT